MTSISIETLFTILFVMIDDWYQSKGHRYVPRTAGRKAKFSNSEVLTLMLGAEYLPFPSENQYLGYMRANHSALFPDLLSQSQFNRRARGLSYLAEMLRRDWLIALAIEQEDIFLIDTKPLPVLGYKRSKRRSDFSDSAAYGYCASRKLYYFGYKLVMITTLDGLPVVYGLVAANTDERLAAEAVIDHIQNAVLIGDKGFIGVEWQAQMHEQTGNSIITPKRKNQLKQHRPGFDKMLNKARRRIEGLFHELQNTGRNLERMLAKSIAGLRARLSAKVAAHLFKHILRKTKQIDVQIFQGPIHFT